MRVRCQHSRRLVNATDAALRARQLHVWAKATGGGLALEYEAAGSGGEALVEYVGVKVQVRRQANRANGGRNLCV